MFFDVDQSRHASIKKNCARNKLNSSELKKVEDPLRLCGSMCSASFQSKRSALRNDLRPLDG